MIDDALRNVDRIPNMPLRNPWLADSVYPISHDNPAATDAVLHAGPVKGRSLSNKDVKTIEGLFTSNPTVKNVKGETVVLAAGLDGIRKINATGERFDLVSFLPYPGFGQLAEKATHEALQELLGETTAARRAKDDAKLLALSRKANALGFHGANVANGVYNLVDKDGFHYAVFGGLCIVKTTDDNEPGGPLRVVAVKNLAEGLPPGRSTELRCLAGLVMTYQGFIAAPSLGGVLFLLDRDLNVLSTVTFSGERIENSVCADEEGLYVVTSKRMLKLVWTGSKLSFEERDGGWQSAYSTMSSFEATAAGAVTSSGGSGTTPTLMGFGDDTDKLVLIADADPKGANIVAFWRDKIPPGFRRKRGAMSRRIADQIRTDLSKVMIEPSPAVLGYGVVVLNNSYPNPVHDIWGNAMTSGVSRPAPIGAQRFDWNPRKKTFEKVWINLDVDNTDVMGPVISAKSGMLYTASKRDGRYEYVGLSWKTGKLQARWVPPDDGTQWNAYGGITVLLENGDLLIGGLFAIKRLNIGSAGGDAKETDVSSVRLLAHPARTTEIGGNGHEHDSYGR